MSIGCGDGSVDMCISEFCKMLVGFDYSNQMISRANSRRIKNGIFWQQSYFDKIDDTYNIDKIYTLGVVQYCKPEDIQLFVDRQLELCNKNKEYVIFHADIPDKKKAWNWYRRFLPQLDEMTVRENEEKLKTYNVDGSYWHDIDDIIGAFESRGIKNCHVLGGISDYRSSIVIKFNGKEITHLKI